MLQSKGTSSVAGSRLMTYGGLPFEWRWELMRLMNVVFPDPSSSEMRDQNRSAKISFPFSIGKLTGHSYTHDHCRALGGGVGTRL